MPKFRKKPIVIEAVQWFQMGDHPAVVKLPTHVPVSAGGREYEFSGGLVESAGAIKTLEGWHLVTPGDWIITGVNGEHYACKPDIFEKTYDPVEYPPPTTSGGDGV